VCLMPAPDAEGSAPPNADLREVLAELRALDPTEIALLGRGDEAGVRLDAGAPRIESIRVPFGAARAEAVCLALSRLSAEWVLIWERGDRLAPGGAAVMRAFLTTTADVGVLRRHYARAAGADASDVALRGHRLGYPEDAPLLVRRTSVAGWAGGGPTQSLDPSHLETATEIGGWPVVAELAVDVVSYARARMGAAALGRTPFDSENGEDRADGWSCTARAVCAFSVDDFGGALRAVDEAWHRLSLASMSQADHFVLAVVAAESSLASGDLARTHDALDAGERSHGEHRVLSFLRGRAFEQSELFGEALISFHRAIVLGHGLDCPRRFWWLSSHDDIAGWLGWLKVASCHERLREPRLAFSAAAKALRFGGLLGPGAGDLRRLLQRLDAQVPGPSE
jgi:hypothetical protein